MSELGPEAREILNQGRAGDDPSPADRGRIRASLMAAIAAGAVGTAAGTANAAVAKGVASTGASTAFVASKPIAATFLGSVVFKGFLAVFVGALGFTTVALWPESKPEKAPVQASASLVVAPLVTEPLPAPSPMEQPAKPAEPSASAMTVPLPPKSTPRATSSAKSPRANEETADSLIAETQRLRDAHGALQGGDAEKALALLSDRAAENEGQKLREERAAARVLALCKLGRVDEANAEAAAFLAQNPRSPLAPRVRKACPSSP